MVDIDSPQLLQLQRCLSLLRRGIPRNLKVVVALSDLLDCACSLAKADDTRIIFDYVLLMADKRIAFS